jgi:hypothetical protein
MPILWAAEVADYIANFIIAEPQENAKWIAKWQTQQSPQGC